MYVVVHCDESGLGQTVGPLNENEAIQAANEILENVIETDFRLTNIDEKYTQNGEIVEVGLLSDSVSY